MNVPINKKNNEKKAICFLDKDTSPNNGEFAQANFLYSTSSEYINTNFKKIIMSRENEEFNEL